MEKKGLEIFILISLLNKKEPLLNLTQKKNEIISLVIRIVPFLMYL